MNLVFKKIFNILVYIFAVIGFALTVGFFAVKYGFTNTNGIIDNQRDSFIKTNRISDPKIVADWNKLPEWQTIKDALLKDKTVIDKASEDSDVPSRIIVSNLVVEQLRLFFSERESYKKFFEPLKILGSQTQFSWGVMGIKEETAKKIEQYLKDDSSDFYPGDKYKNLLDFKTDNISSERFTRMTDQHNHYFSYLYAGLYIKEIESQWQKTGLPISDKPEIISTLYNIGFSGSKPNPNPASGGAEIEVGGKKYSFGSLSKEFYYSDELLEEFPK